MIDQWEHDASIGDSDFRWSGDIEVEMAEYLLHGLDRCICSEKIHARLTLAELATHAPFTLHVVQALVDGLSAEGRCQEHLCDQVRISLGAALDH